MIDRRFTADIVAGLIVNRGGVRGGDRDKRGGKLRLRTRLDLQACKIGKDWIDARSRKRQARAPMTSRTGPVSQPATRLLLRRALSTLIRTVSDKGAGRF
jgi:hypothetical protein